MRILGISAMGHDPAAALVGEPRDASPGNAQVLAAIEEGKLARTRSLGGIPRQAIQFCLAAASADWKDVDCVAVASRPVTAWMHTTAFRMLRAPFSPVRSAYFINKVMGELGRELNNFRILREMAASPDRLESFDHHLSHAASSFFASPHDHALIVSLDEQGDGQAGLVAVGEGTAIRELSRIPLPHSLGWFFSRVTSLLGFHSRIDEHKTQWLGLSAEPSLADVFVAMLRRHPQGPPHLNSQYFDGSFGGAFPFSSKFYRCIGVAPPRAGAAPHIPEAARATIAASLQQACATVLCDWLKSLRKQTGHTSLCLAGGLFLNPLIVYAIERTTGFTKVFVQPAAGNEGTALGAAWLAWYARRKDQHLAPPVDT